MRTLKNHRNDYRELSITILILADKNHAAKVYTYDFTRPVLSTLCSAHALFSLRFPTQLHQQSKHSEILAYYIVIWIINLCATPRLEYFLIDFLPLHNIVTQTTEQRIYSAATGNLWLRRIVLHAKSRVQLGTKSRDRFPAAAAGFRSCT